jgi:two-component system, OmpR family, alkaline phosphatase synthesis response regulator PhoP
MSSELVLVVDDEENIVNLTRLYLEREGFRVKSAGDGKSALMETATLKPALIVLDIMIPEIDGFEVCKQIRREGNDVPILILTARDDDFDKILGLELGADDYMTKPFNPRELTARVKAILRRTSATVDEKQETIQFGDIVIDQAKREISVDGASVSLRTQEFEVLLILAKYQGKVLTREKLLNLAWGFDFLGQTRTVDVHIAHLRNKLSMSSVRIETVTGIGYKLVV